MKPARRGALFAALLLAGCAANSGTSTPVPAPRSDPAEWRYALVIDASSSASTLFVYQWREGERLPRIEPAPAAAGETWTFRVRPGLSDFAESPEEAAASLRPLIDYALEKIPPAERERTSLHLWATAGLRRLEPDQADGVLRAIDRFFSETPFAAAPARVISGTEEGIYGWLTVNYLLGHLEHGGSFPTVGALDLGGASTQITFVPLDHPREGGQVIRLGGNAYHLYSHSYLGLGQDVVREAIAVPECYPRGYALTDGGGDGVSGTGDLAACRQIIRRRLARPCPEEPCSAFGVYQPPVYGDFLGFSVYAYTTAFFELGGRLTPSELERSGAAFCAASWPERVARDPGAADDRFLPRYCFAAAYIVELLTEGFGFSPTTERIQAPLRVQGTETGWTLGALLYELAGEGD